MYAGSNHSNLCDCYFLLSFARASILPPLTLRLLLRSPQSATLDRATSKTVPSEMLLRSSSHIRKLLSYHYQIGTRNSPIFLSLFSTTSRRKKGKGDSDSDSDDRNGVGLFLLGRDPSRVPKLFVVQPRLRPELVLQSKLEEALNLANSLEQPRDGFYEEEFESKGLPPHLVVQNPAVRSTRAHAGLFSLNPTLSL